MKLPNKPNMTWDTIKRMEDMTWFTYAQIFDDLLIVAQKETNCFVWKTEKGLVVMDGIWPDKRAYDAIVNAIRDVGWDENEICKYVVTHGHVDHAGCGKWLVENHHATTYLSEIDTEFWEKNPTKPDRPETWKDFEIDEFVREGDTIDCGDKTIYVYDTPGHTPGCLSFVFAVEENGERHMAALFGGATPPWNNEEGKKQYKKSIEHLKEVTKEKKVDVALFNHTAFDQGLDRIAYSKNRLSYMPNIYVLGQDGYQKHMVVYENLCD